MRERDGELGSFLLDDKLGAAHTLSEACYRCLTGVLLFSAAGVFFSIPKSVLWPQQQLKWLGLLLHSSPWPYWSVPEDKMRDIEGLIAGLLQQGCSSATLLAQLAGKLVSIQDAAPLPHLVADALFIAIKDYQAWQQIMPLPGRLELFLGWLQQQLPALNGSKWFKQPRPLLQLRLVADTSEQAHVAHLFEKGTPVLSIQLPFLQQLHCMPCQAAG